MQLSDVVYESQAFFKSEVLISKTSSWLKTSVANSSNLHANTSGSLIKKLSKTNSKFWQQFCSLNIRIL